MKNFTDLHVWHVGLQLVEEIYSISKQFPEDERFGLTAQIKRSSQSILANIAEGFGRYTFPDKAARYIIARGECSETDAHLRIAIHLRFVSADEAMKAIELIKQERRLLSGLIHACKQR